MNLKWSTHGEGAPLLLLHGFTGTGDDWHHVFGQKPTGMTHLMPDLPGHGGSRSLAHFTFREAANLIREDLDDMGIDALPAIGMSGGAQALIHLGTSQPDRINETILISTAPYFPQQARALMQAAGPERQSQDTWVDMRRKHGDDDQRIRTLFETARDFHKSYDDVNFTPPLLGRMRGPSLIVHGDSDPLYPVSCAVGLFEAIPDARLWIMPGQGHCPVFGANAGVFRATALDFLGGRVEVR